MIAPHGSSEFGTSLERPTAALLKRAGSIRLFTNGALSVIWRPTLHAGDARVVKSPANIAAVGTKVRTFAGSERMVVP